MAEEEWRGDQPKRPKKSFEHEMIDLLTAEPFQSFIIMMNSGERIEVKSPYALFMEDTVYVVYRRDGASLLRISAITNIDIPEVI